MANYSVEIVGSTDSIESNKYATFYGCKDAHDFAAENSKLGKTRIFEKIRTTLSLVATYTNGQISFS